MQALDLEVLFDPRVAMPAFVTSGARITRWNEAARHLLGGDLGQPITAAFEDASRDKLSECLAGAPRSCELQVRSAGHEPVVAQFSVIPIDRGDRLVLAARSGLEYSDRAARQVLEANAHLANLTRALSQQSAELEASRRRFEALADLRAHFVSMLAHDVRGALQSILSGADIVEDAMNRADGATIAKVFPRMRRAAQRIRDLVDKVLEAARTEAGRMVLDAQPVRLSQIVDETLEIYEPVAASRGVSLARAKDAAPGDLVGDRVRLGQVVGNLVENAIRHSARAGEVRVEIAEGDDRVRLVVRDQGSGIAGALREQLFDRFVQGPGHTGSLGLGLYVVKQIVEAHHGEVFVEDSVPHGAAFVVELPKAKTATSASPTPAAAPPGSPGSAGGAL